MNFRTRLSFLMLMMSFYRICYPMGELDRVSVTPDCKQALLNIGKACGICALAICTKCCIAVCAGGSEWCDHCLPILAARSPFLQRAASRLRHDANRNEQIHCCGLIKEIGRQAYDNCYKKGERVLEQCCKRIAPEVRMMSRTELDDIV